MSFESMMMQTVTVIRLSQATSTTDAEGNAVPNAPSEIQYSGLIQQRDATEVIVGPDTLISNHQLFLPADALIDGRDRVEESGRVFEVVGTPFRVNTPRGEHHVEANLREVTN